MEGGGREGTPRGRPPLAESHPCHRSMWGSKSPPGRGPGSEGKALGTQLAPGVRDLVRGRCGWGSWARWEPEPEAWVGLAPSSRAFPACCWAGKWVPEALPPARAFSRAAGGRHVCRQELVRRRPLLRLRQARPL